MAENRGSIGFSATYRPPVPLDIFSCPLPPTSKQDELPMTDGVNYNYNGQVISSAALKTILNRKELASEVKKADVNSGPLSGMVFVSERQEGLELLHIALRFNDNPPPKPKIFCLADVFGKVNFSGVRMEDSGCIAGDNLVYVTTKDPAPKRRQPWTAVYKTNLKTGKTDRLTPSGEADLSPSVAPSGTKIAVASFQEKRRGWDGEIEDLQTDVFVMNVEKPFNRHKVISNGGWPTWGSDNVIFFHRKDGKFWGVFRVDLSNNRESRVTPEGIQAITPAAIDATTVAVATIRQESKFSDVVRVEAQYRHIEIFNSTGQQQTQQITQKTMPKADHFNPFVVDGGKRIGYHRCNSNLLKSEDDIPRNSHKLESPYLDVGLFRVPGIFPTFSSDGSKLAFVDNKFKALWVADSNGLREVYTAKGPDNMFSPVWNQNPKKDIVYVSMGPSFQSDQTLHICAIPNVSNGAKGHIQLTRVSNNAFPSTNSEGTKLVFRSTRDGGDKRYKNLYIMEDAQIGEFEGGKITRLTEGLWTDTHCQWSPTGDWIVFSSTRDKPKSAPESDNGLDPGYFAVFLVKANDSKVIVRVMASGNDIAGHVNHPFFSPDGKSIVVTADLAAVSVDPISLPLFLHSVRPYGDIFTFDIDSANINKSKNVKTFNRITHSRYENSTATWTRFSTQDSNAAWNKILNEGVTPSCPYAQDEVKSWQHMTGHLCIRKRCC
ncbi:Tol-Pal system protein TolB [Camellia lanceoleosa]|uniref:Tol-Pal system protein TolB n=1 Tax=Camellia lanceoleosa TaxID=1840588 RepID=A0ACC0I6P0_9ERIC|nr:Tol-Pal system protein TolB [Camellia lanceoleosa]